MSKYTRQALEKFFEYAGLDVNMDKLKAKGDAVLVTTPSDLCDFNLYVEKIAGGYTAKRKEK